VIRDWCVQHQAVVTVAIYVLMAFCAAVIFGTGVQAGDSDDDDKNTRR
jgi:hypothetical protein